MTDDPRRPRRPGSLGEGDPRYVRTEKHRSAPRGVPIQDLPTWDEVPDEVTGRYEGEELAMYRSRRETKERLAKLESKHDAVDERLRVIEISTTKSEQHLLVLVDEAERKKKAEEKAVQFRRRILIKIAGGVFSGGVLGALASLAVRGC